MNKLKSVFITLFCGYCFMVAILAAWRLMPVWTWCWLGLFMSSVAASSLFIRLFVWQKARTSENFPILTAVIVFGVALSAWGLGQNFQAVPAALAIGLVCGWFLYVYLYSRFSQRDRSLIREGHSLPDFAVQDLQGNTIHSSQLTAEPALLLFFRGNWCPLCMAQIKEVAAEYQQLAARGVRVCLISPQPAIKSQKLAAKYAVPFWFLADPAGQAAQQLGIFDPSGTPAGMELLGYESDTVLPTVIMTDAEGKIIFADLTDNYRVRPEPQTFLDIWDAHTA